MLEKYYKYKMDYREYVLLFQYGNFYECFDIDAFIISKIFKYKLGKFKDSYKCGFPVSKLSNILDGLCDNSINFVVIDEDINKREFDYNRYLEYKIDDSIKDNIKLINKIINYLNNNEFNIEINNKLKSIWSIIYER